MNPAQHIALYANAGELQWITMSQDQVALLSLAKVMMRHVLKVSLADKLPVGGTRDGITDSQEKGVLQEVIQQSLEDQALPVE